MQKNLRFALSFVESENCEFWSFCKNKNIECDRKLPFCQLELLIRKDDSLRKEVSKTAAFKKIRSMDGNGHKKPVPVFKNPNKRCPFLHFDFSYCEHFCIYRCDRVNNGCLIGVPLRITMDMLTRDGRI